VIEPAGHPTRPRRQSVLWIAGSAFLALLPVGLLWFLDTAGREWLIRHYGLHGWGSAPFNWLLRTAVVGIEAVLALLLAKLTASGVKLGRILFWAALAWVALVACFMPLTRYAVR